MNTVTIVLLVIAVILLIALGVLTFLGRRMQKKQDILQAGQIVGRKFCD